MSSPEKMISTHQFRLSLTMARSTRPASHKSIPTRPRMRNQQIEHTVIIKHQAVGSRRSPVIDVVVRHDGVFVPGPGGGEVEAFIVVVAVGVVVC